MSASLIGHLGSSAFRLSTTTVSMSLAGSCFSSDSKTRWNNLYRGLTVRRTIGPSGHANSPHPSSREGLLSTAWWNFEFSPIAFGYLRPSCYRGLSGAPDFCAVNPNAVHDHGQPARQRHDSLLHSAVPGDLHRPSFEP